VASEGLEGKEDVFEVGGDVVGAVGGEGRKRVGEREREGEVRVGGMGRERFRREVGRWKAPKILVKEAD
jgi:hypothetical protein